MRRWVALGALLGLAPLPAAASSSLETLEARLALHLRAARTAREVPALEAHSGLSRIAEERVRELAGRTDLGSSSGELTELERRLRRRGYAPHYWRMALVAGHLEAATIGRTRLEPDLLRPELEHVAVSCAPWTAAPARTPEGTRAKPEGQTLCLIMVAERQVRYQLRVAEPLRDLETVRQAVLAEVNRLRRSRGLAELQASTEANRAAQRHAEDMLERRFYSHQNPEGEGPRERSAAAGFSPRGVAENLAKVVTTPEDAVARWMASSGHRRNLLRRGATSHGLGVAVGIDDGEVVALWCQLLGG